MKTPRILFLLTLALTGLAAITATEAGQVRLEVKVLDDVDKDRDTEDVGKDGVTKTEKQEVGFMLEVKNRGFDELKDLKAKVYIFSEDAFHPDRTFQKKKIFESKPFSLKFNGVEEQRLGQVEFSFGMNQKPIGAATIAIRYGGDKYGGWVAEIIQDGKVIHTEYDNKDSKKAYEKLTKGKR